MALFLKSSEEIEKIAVCGKILADVLQSIYAKAEIGVSLAHLDSLAFKMIKEAGAEPAFLGYQPNGAKHPYQFSICASVNNVIVHGLPSNYQLQNGDVLKIDLGVKYIGYYADAAITIGIGKISSKANLLMKATKEALDEATKICKPGNHLGDIGFTISGIAKRYGFKVVKGLTGHGVGFDIHEDPTIYNYGERGEGIELKAGMVLAIEPMLAIGTDRIIQLADESWATSDGSLSAHFEHTIAITKNGCRVLTE